MALRLLLCTARMGVVNIPMDEFKDKPVSADCSITVRALSSAFSLFCLAGAVLAGGLLFLAKMNMRIQNLSHVIVGFMGGISITISLIAFVRLGFYPSPKGLLWFLVSSVGFWLFLKCFSLPGAMDLLH